MEAGRLEVDAEPFETDSLVTGVAHHEGTELMRMMTMVNKRVAYVYETRCNNEKYDGMKQVPFLTSTLTKEVYFNPR